MDDLGNLDEEGASSLSDLILESRVVSVSISCLTGEDGALVLPSVAL